MIDDIAHIQAQDYSFEITSTAEQLFDRFREFGNNQYYMYFQFQSQNFSVLQKFSRQMIFQLCLNTLYQEEKNIIVIIYTQHNIKLDDGKCRYITVLSDLYDLKILEVVAEQNSYILKFEPPKFLQSRGIIPIQEESMIIKSPDVDKFINDDNALKTLIEGFNRELNLLEKLQSIENFVHLYSYIQIFGQRFLLLKFYPIDLQQLFDKIQQEQKELQIQYVYRLVYSLLEGLNKLHDLDIIHRDIKPSNIFLINYEDINQVRCIYADFDRSKNCTIHNTTLSTTDGYQPPEVQFLSEKGYTKKWDVWALGLLIYQIANQGIYPGKPDMQMNQVDYINYFSTAKIKQKILHFQYEPKFIEFIRLCLTNEQVYRPDTQKAFKNFQDIFTQGKDQQDLSSNQVQQTQPTEFQQIRSPGQKFQIPEEQKNQSQQVQQQQQSIQINQCSQKQQETQKQGIINISMKSKPYESSQLSQSPKKQIGFKILKSLTQVQLQN